MKRARRSWLVGIAPCLLAACQQAAPPPPAAPEASVPVSVDAAVVPDVADAAPPPTDATIVDAAVDAQDSGDSGPAARAPSYEAVSAEIVRACPRKSIPAGSPEWPGLLHDCSWEFEAADCMNRYMSRALDKVLIPMKKSDPARFAALMKEQADWNALQAKVVFLSEEWSLSDPKTGYRGLEPAMGNHGWLYAFAKRDLAKERLLYAKSLLAGDASQVVARVQQLEKIGRAKLVAIQQWTQAAARHIATPPPPPTGEFEKIADWGDIRDALAIIQTMSKRLAHSTCTVSFPELVTTYGSQQSCEERLELYYLAHDVRQ